MIIAGPSSQASPPPLPPQVLSKRSGRAIRMPHRFVDYLSGSAIPLAHMPKKLPRSHVPPQPDEHPQSKHSDDGSSFVDQPHADPFETEPDSMGLFRIYPTRPPQTT